MTLGRAEIRQVAREVLGHRSLLPGQADAVRSIVDGRDTLALLPTGGGKSAIYQLAGIERPGPTIVVSPLIALQRDQLEGLAEVGLPGAALNSTLGEQEREGILDDLAAGRIEFLLLAPEQLADAGTRSLLRDAGPSLLVVDEAHCVSEWGHDFRPEYRRIGAAAEDLGRPPILALTATASPPVRDEIVEWLRLRDPEIVARGFDRPNIDLAVEHHAGTVAKRRAVVDWVVAAEKPAIVYAATRRGAEDLARDLAGAGVRTEAYHAGIAAKRRAAIQDAFMEDDLAVVVATIAFGMGVDKDDVRSIAHADVSDSLDAYHQEIGRAGRDGGPASARLFFDAADLGLRRFQGVPPPFDVSAVRTVVRALGAGAPDAEAIAARSRLSRRRADQILGRLESLGAVALDPAGRVSATSGLDDPTLAAEAVAAQERRRAHARSRVELLRGYADTEGCRRRFLLNALGEEYEPPCGACDNCRAGLVTQADRDVGDDRGPFALNDRVVHVTFGAGTVSRVEGDRVTVRFEDVGYRTLALGEVIERGLLHPLD